MADPKKDGKKDGKKDAKGGGGGLPLEAEIFFWILISAIGLLVVLPTILKLFGFSTSGFSFSNWWAGFSFSAVRAFSAFFSSLIFFSIFFSLIFIIGVMYAKFKLAQVGHEQAATKEALGETGGREQAALSQMSDKNSLVLPAGLPGAEDDRSFIKPVENEKWKDVQKHMESGNQTDWRMAILEADIMLYDMLDQMGYEGDSIGEKLKQVERASFNTLDEAWRAHKVRNIIAHEGASYILPRHEAERAIRQYEAVFKEFYYI
jgi:hypothetical protein